VQRGLSAIAEHLVLYHIVPYRYVTEVGEVDPVYSFLKLTSGIPREGGSVIPDEDHYCCSKTDQDLGVVSGEAAGLSITYVC